MKKILISFFLIILSGMSYSQETKDILKDENYVRYEKEALALYNAKTYLNYQQLLNEFSTNLGKADFDFGNNDFERWIEENIQKTNFKSKKDAIDLYKKLQDSQSDQLFSQIKAVNKKGHALRVKYGEAVFDKVCEERIFSKIFKNQTH